MPDKPLTVITYAASASLAAVALVYFFNPNYIIDNETSSSASARKKGVVGLSNPANDCFINSVLQSLAGLRELRLYLIRELHRRNLDSADIYRTLPGRRENEKPLDFRKLLSLQSGEVTQGLKIMLDRLNERPIHRKTISAGDFVGVLEHAFATRISKSQQDAQELLQIVAERLSEEYHAGRAARVRGRDAVDKLSVTGLGLLVSDNEPRPSSSTSRTLSPSLNEPAVETSAPDEEEDGFPLEGKTESVIECQHCHFVPKANPISFVMLTLPVPQKSAASLSECFDSHFKTEYIDDYKCDKCRLTHALSVFETDLRRARTQAAQSEIEADIAKIQAAIEEDPENPPKNVRLPESKYAPTRRISRHSRITHFPNVLVVHLSRSIYDVGSISTKNLAKVSFPERLPLGGLVDRRNYKLLAAVSHKGTHNSGHYETFRRQHQYAPTSTPHIPQDQGPYSRANTPTPSGLPSPRISALGSRPSQAALDRAALDRVTESVVEPSSTASSSPSLSSNNTTSSTVPSSQSLHNQPAPTSAPAPSLSPTKRDSLQVPRSSESVDLGRSSSVDSGRRDSSATQKAMSIVDSAGNKIRESKRRRAADRWWRISDDKIKECRTGDLLGMQKEVYMLFYEIEKEEIL